MMRRKTALLLLIILAAGMICGTGTAADAADYAPAGDYISDRGILALFYRSRTPVEDLKAFLRADGGSVQKTQMHFADMRAKQRELETLPALFPEVAVTTSVPSNIEINIRAANKGAARALRRAGDPA